MANQVVFITGGTGFIGSHVVKATLEAGYIVRLAVRRPEQVTEVRQRYAGRQSQVEVVIIPDITRLGCYDLALADVDVVFHLASPMPGKGTDFKTDYLDPAVQGTEILLFAAMRFSRVKKVIITSSVVALLPPATLLANDDVVVKDNTGEEVPVDLNSSYTDDFHGHVLKYTTSKIMAHKATRRFLDENRPNFSVITLHPTFVLGYSPIQSRAQDIDGVNALFWSSVFSEKPIMPSALVHVRDVANAFVHTLKISTVGGTEFLLSGPNTCWDDIVAFIRKQYPSLGCKLIGPFEGRWDVDTANATNTLGLEWEPMETIVKEVIDQQLNLATEKKES